MVSINCELQGPWRTRSGCSTRSPPARSPAGSRRRPREEVRGAVAWAGGSAGWSPCGGCCWGPPAWTRADSSTGRSRDTQWISPLVWSTTCILFYVYRFVIYNLQVQILVTMERRTCLTGKVEAVERCRLKNHIFCRLSFFSNKYSLLQDLQSVQHQLWQLWSGLHIPGEIGEYYFLIFTIVNFLKTIFHTFEQSLFVC